MKYVYLLWEDNIILKAFSSYGAAQAALYAELNKSIYDEVVWANESCGITFATTTWGEKVEFEIQEVEVSE